MKYYIEQDELIIGQYLSILPTKERLQVHNKEYKHVKQVITRITFSLYVDDVAIYKSVKGIKKQRKEKLPFPLICSPHETLGSLSGIKAYEMPLLNVTTDYDNNYIITKQSYDGDTLTVRANRLHNVNEKKGLTLVTSISHDYQESLWASFSESDTIKQFNTGVKFLIDSLKSQVDDSTLHSLIVEYLQPLPYDSGIAVLSKYTDYCCLFDIAKKIQKGNMSDIKLDNYCNYNRKTILDKYWRKASRLYRFNFYSTLGPDKYKYQIALQNRYGKAYLSTLTSALRQLSKASDKEWAKTEASKIRKRWIESGLVAREDEWSDFIKIYKDIQSN